MPGCTEARTESERRTGMEILKRLHARRWEGSTGETRGGAGGVFGSVFFARFHERTGPDLLKAEVLKLMWLTVRDEPIAAVYNLDWRGRVYFYQCGRRLDVPKAIRPGTVLLVMAIRRAMEAGRREFDLLAGDVRYKRELATGTRPLVRLRVARPGCAASAAGARGDQVTVATIPAERTATARPRNFSA
jgi:CelD/BcsL family acetyltransferase involved in cellulose biosynthesis